MRSASSQRSQNRFFASLPGALRRLIRRLRPSLPSGRYRPEKHYMRGTGPKSRRAARDGGQGPKAA